MLPEAQEHRLRFLDRAIGNPGENEVRAAGCRIAGFVQDVKRCDPSKSCLDALVKVKAPCGERMETLT